MKKTYKSILILVILIIFLVLYLIHSNLIINALLDYSVLFLTKLFPVSFIFFIFSSLIIEYGLIELIQCYLKINTSSLYIFLISMISGFPSGAKYTRELFDAKLITLDNANKTMMFSHFPNPLFILGSVYSILNDKVLAIKILISIILSNLIIFIFIKRDNNLIHNKYNLSTDFSTALSKAINNSFQSILLIYGTSLFFYLIATIIINYISLSTNYYILINGLFDLTKGVFSTVLIENNISRAFYILFFISFGSFSIHMQVKSIINNTSIDYKYFLKGRIIGTIIAFGIFMLLI